jgi:hypothetical protein
VNPAFTPLSFHGRRAPPVDKVINDGKRMFEHARYVIVLDQNGRVTQSFENPPFGKTLVDCLVVLAPLMYRNTWVAQAVLLEIGFRRFVPYAQTEYRVNGKIKAIKPRRPVCKLSDKVMVELLPHIGNAIQVCVNSIIMTWEKSIPIQVRVVGNYTYIASIFVKIPEEEKIFCAVVRFAEFRLRLSPSMTLGSCAILLKKTCERFIKASWRYKTESGDYLNSRVRKSGDANFIADTLRTRIKFRGYTRQMVDEMLALVGKEGSPERELINQIWKLYKIPVPVRDTALDVLEKEYGHLKSQLLSRWKLGNFISYRHQRKRMSHARGALTISVLGSEVELRKMIVEHDKNRKGPTEDEDDEDIPF